MAAETEPPALSVSLLALPETTPTSLYGLLEVFSAVGVAWTELTGEAAPAPRLDTRIIARETRPFVTRSGIPLAPARAIADVEACDVAIVTDLMFDAGVDPRGRWPHETAWMRAQFERGATVCSVCTGSVFLAEAGLLDGEEATTHWGATEIFRRCYPAVRLKAERILCQSGPERRIVTGGGPAAWADLALYLIARFCGAAEAVRISKIFVLGDHADGQLPFTAMNRHRYHEDSVIGECQAWIAHHYAEPNPVARMIGHSKLPERTFKRRFRQATGYAPIEYVQALRIEEAREWLESSNEPVDEVAHKVGYEDPAYFRKLFKRRTGTTPARYRQRFQSIGRIAMRAGAGVAVLLSTLMPGPAVADVVRVQQREQDGCVAQEQLAWQMGEKLAPADMDIGEKHLAVSAFTIRADHCETFRVRDVPHATCLDVGE